MSKKEDFIPHRKLDDFSDLGINSTRDNIISSKEDFINNQSNNNTRNINDIDDNSHKTDTNLESLYEQLIQANERIQFLNQENFNLKQIIENKDSIISEYEETLGETADKMIKLQNINENLKSELDMIKLNNNENENIPNNQYLLDSINDIKYNLDLIENNYNQKIIEKENIINDLNYNLQMNNNYNNQTNDILNSIYSENNMLKNKINCLLKEKEILMDEKEKNHNEIIKLQEIINSSDYLKNSNLVKELEIEYQEKENNYINMLKNQEKEYILQISNLHNVVIEREKEIDNLKEKYQNVIMKLNIDNESLRNKLNCIENLPIKNNIGLIYDNNNNKNSNNI